jgi:ATP-dependent Clp endopeptidase proteolytic subunit ClpP
MPYTIDPSADEPIMLINTYIGFDETEGYGIMGAAFETELLQLDSLGKKRIQVWINSPGGSVTDGYSIYNAILQSKTPVDTVCVGMAASIAGVIFQAGRRRIMVDYGILMYHNPFITGGATAAEKKMLDAMKSSIVTMVSKRSGMSENDVAAMMDRTTFIEAIEAKEKGLCDEILNSADANLKWVKKPATQNMVSYFSTCREVLNKFCISNKATMEPVNPINGYFKIPAYLGLNTEATPDAVLNSIMDIANKNKDLEVKIIALNKKAEKTAEDHKEELDKLKADMEEMDKKMKAKQKEYDDCKAKLDAITKDKEEAEDREKTEKAKNMVTGYAEQGRITNEPAVIDEWVVLAKDDFAKVENMLKKLPLNKEAAKLKPVENRLAAGEMATTAMNLQAKVMAGIKNKK